ncbi:MAG: ABC transporter substrate-binding protein, partial [Anaerolineae bacterium]
MRTNRLFKILVLVLVLGLAVAGMAACAKKATPTAPPPYQAKPTATPEPTTPPPPTPTPVPTKPVIVLALDSDIDHIELMEFRSDAGYYATANLYEPMLEQKLVPDADGTVLEGQLEYVPALAESFAVAPDGKSITLKIRQGAKFADGTEITAESFKHTFDRALTAPRSYIPLLTQFMGFSKAEDVVVVDKYTLRINLQQQGALLIPQLAFQVFGAMDPATTKAHATAEDPWAFDWYRKNANPSGPYILTKWEPGVEYVFEPNPNYWKGPDFFQNSKVIAKVVPSPE